MTHAQQIPSETESLMRQALCLLDAHGRDDAIPADLVERIGRALPEDCDDDAAGGIPFLSVRADAWEALDRDAPSHRRKARRHS